MDRSGRERGPAVTVASRRRIVVGAAAVAALAACPVARAQPGPLRIGLLPYLSPRAMLAVWEPLREHLQAELSREVELLGSVSFEAVLDNARRADQPVALLPAHFTRLALADWGFTLVARARADAVAHLWGLASRVRDARARPAVQRVAVIDALALTTLVFERWRGVAASGGASFQVERHSNISSALMALRRGEVDLVAGTEAQVADALGAEARTLLVSEHRLGTLVPHAFAAAPTLPQAQVDALRRALLRFAPARAGGTAGAAWVAGSPADFEPYEGFAEVVRRHLAVRGPTR